MLLRPRSIRPTKTPFIASVVVVAAVVATLGLTRGDLVATALAMPFSTATAAETSDPAPIACTHRCHQVQQVVYVAPSKGDTQSMERVILAQIAEVRKNDSVAVCRYVSGWSSSTFVSDPTASLQRLALLATSDKLTFSHVTIGPCHHDGYLTVTGYVKGIPTYTASYVVTTQDVVHPKWGVSSVDVALAVPPAPVAATAHHLLPDTAKS